MHGRRRRVEPAGLELRPAGRGHQHATPHAASATGRAGGGSERPPRRASTLQARPHHGASSQRRQRDRDEVVDLAEAEADPEDQRPDDRQQHARRHRPPADRDRDQQNDQRRVQPQHDGLGVDGLRQDGHQPGRRRDRLSRVVDHPQRLRRRHEDQQPGESVEDPKQRQARGARAPRLENLRVDEAPAAGRALTVRRPAGLKGPRRQKLVRTRGRSGGGSTKRSPSSPAGRRIGPTPARAASARRWDRRRARARRRACGRDTDLRRSHDGPPQRPRSAACRANASQ